MQTESQIDLSDMPSSFEELYQEITTSSEPGIIADWVPVVEHPTQVRSGLVIPPWPEVLKYPYLCEVAMHNSAVFSITNKGPTLTEGNDRRAEVLIDNVYPKKPPAKLKVTYYEQPQHNVPNNGMFECYVYMEPSSEVQLSAKHEDQNLLATREDIEAAFKWTTKAAGTGDSLTLQHFIPFLNMTIADAAFFYNTLFDVREVNGKNGIFMVFFDRHDRTRSKPLVDIKLTG